MPNLNKFKAQSCLRKIEFAISVFLLILSGKAGAAVIPAATEATPKTEPGVKRDLAVSEQITRALPKQVLPASDSPRVLIFTAEWCEPCKQMAPAIEEARVRFGAKAQIVVIDLDDPQKQKLIEELNVTTVPAVVCMDHGGHVTAETVGFRGADYFFDFVKDAISERTISQSH